MPAVLMYKKDKNNMLVFSNLADKHAEYDLIKKQVFGMQHKASYYKTFATLQVKDQDIVALKEKHIKSFYKELVAYYKIANGFVTDFDAMPLEVQQALLDMAFSLGITKLKNQYKNMNTHIKSKDWTKAAAESARSGIGKRRNDYVENLFLAALNPTKNP